MASLVDRPENLALSSDPLSGAVLTISEKLLRLQDFDEAVRSSLEVLCKAVEMDRCALLDNVTAAGEPGLELWRGVAEYCQPGITPQLTSDQSTGSLEDMRVWRDMALAGATSLDARAGEFPDAALNVAMAALETRYTVVFPIWIDGALWGWLGFDDCTTDRVRSGKEKRALTTAAQIFGLSIDRHRKQARLIEVERQKASADRAARAVAEKRRRLLEVLKDVSDQLLATSSWRHLANRITANVGSALKVDRFRLVRYLPPDEHSERGYLEILNEWTRPGVSRQTEDPNQRVFSMDPYPDVFDQMSVGVPVQALIEELEIEAGREEQAATGAKSQFHYPILVDGTLWGSIGVDDCSEPRVWPEEEISTLQILASALANVIKRESLEEERIHLAESRANENAAHARLLQDILTASRDLLDGDNYEEKLVGWLARLGTSCGAHSAGYGTNELDQQTGEPRNLAASHLDWRLSIPISR